MEYLLTHDLATDRRIPMLTLAPAAGASAGRVVVTHGLGGAKESVLPDLFRLAQAGFAGVAVDLRLHGEWADAPTRQAMLDTDFMAAMQQVVYGTADDISHMLNRWQAEPARTGLIGISTGGMVGHALAIQKERRIGAMVCCISSPDWLTADPTRSPPADSPAGQMLATASPVNHPDSYPPLALLMLNGTADDIVRDMGSILLEERLRPLYAQSGIGERLKLTLYPDLGHDYLREMSELSVAWMQRFLR